jgi:hypothetical protein
MMTGSWVSQAVAAVAKLGIPDLLGEGPVDCDDLAAATGSHAPSLYRLLRVLASVGVFTEASPAHFALTPTAALLCSGRPDSMRALAIIYAEECYRAWGDVLHSFRTGESAFAHHYGVPVFEYFERHPAVGRVFNEAMIGYTNQVAGAVVAAYDFSPFRTVVDVGGGHGALLAAILHDHATARGVLFDLPHVVSGAQEYLAVAGVADRCDRTGGDFFAAVPDGGDAYVLSQILHDWDDDRCVGILTRCRRAMPRHGKLLVVEIVLPPGDEPCFGKWLDVHMLAMTGGGRERTAAEYGALFAAAGLALVRVIPTPVEPSVVEAVPI